MGVYFPKYTPLLDLVTHIQRWVEKKGFAWQSGFISILFNILMLFPSFLTVWLTTEQQQQTRTTTFSVCCIINICFYL
jgi:hypothetical protein